MTQAEKQAIMAEYATHEGDTGSPEVQIAVLTKRINDLTEHLKEHHRITTHAVAFSRWSVTDVISLHTFRRLTSSVTVLLSQDLVFVNKTIRKGRLPCTDCLQGSIGFSSKIPCVFAQSLARRQPCYILWLQHRKFYALTKPQSALK